MTAITEAAVEAEPVAYRWRYTPKSAWYLSKTIPRWHAEFDVECEPLYLAAALRPPAPDAAAEAAVMAEREAIVEQARLYASYYPPHSDGRNTFVILADWILARSAAPLPTKGSGI